MSFYRLLVGGPSFSLFRHVSKRVPTYLPVPGRSFCVWTLEVVMQDAPWYTPDA